MTSIAKAHLVPIDIIKRDWPEIVVEILRLVEKYQAYYRVYKADKWRSNPRFYLVICSLYVQPRDITWLSRHSEIKEYYQAEMQDNWIGFKNKALPLTQDS